MAVALVPWTVISNWSVTSLPVLTMSLTLLSRSVPAVASYTRMFLVSASKM